MSDINEFHNDFRQELLSRADASNQFIESQFVELMAEYLIEAGEMDSFDYTPYRAARGMQVDGYSFDEEQGLLCLFISDFRQSAEPETLTNTDITAAFKRLGNFFEKALSDDFYIQLEETSPGYGLASFISTHANAIGRVQFFLLSDAQLSNQFKPLGDTKVNGVPVSFHVWDLSRLYRLVSSRKTREDVVINFRELFGKNLPCLPAHLGTDSYQSYLIVIPGKMLSGLYERYGARLLEQNVRSFLQVKGGVNKGIRNTILNNPEMFFAYNNGVTATAEAVESVSEAGGMAISSLTNLQIVNGGQTTASIFTAMKKDKASLDRIFVQMKLSVIDPARAMEVVPKISEYANSQNKVNAADFFANHPFHVRLEEFSRRIWAPSSDGSQRESKWFYERARGQYQDAQAYATPAAKKKFELEYPKAQMFNKTDLAKYENSWDQLPYVVSTGAQKNFGVFAGSIGRRWEKDDTQFNELYYRQVIARAILFRATEKLVMNQPWYEGGYRANIVTYAIAWLSMYVAGLGKVFNFENIWKKQAISEATRKALVLITEQVHDTIISTPGGISNVTEWCKREGCWESVKAIRLTPGDDFLKELQSKSEAAAQKNDAKKVQKVDDGIALQTRVFELGGKKWMVVLEWGNSKNLLSPDEVDILRIAGQIPRKIPNENQARRLVAVLSRMEQEGFVFS